jgi:hypothetical protein
MDVHIHMMAHAIPDPLGITLPAVIVLTVNKVMLVVNGLFFTHPHPAVRTVNILDIIFFHENSDYSSRFMGLCMGSP